MSDAAPGLDAEPDAELELRCPQPWGVCPAGRLLAKLRTAGQRPSYVHPDNLIELECPDCKVRMRREGCSVRRVLHRYDFLGQPVETLVVGAGGLGVAGGMRVARKLPGAAAWMARAACGGMDTARWYPISGSVSPEVLATCRRCEVRMECLAFAARTGQSGVWGGMTAKQRAASRFCQQLRREFLSGR